VRANIAIYNNSERRYSPPQTDRRDALHANYTNYKCLALSTTLILVN